MYRYTLSDDPLAVGKSPNHLLLWRQHEGTIEYLVNWAYVQGRAFSAGVYDHRPLTGGEKTVKTSSRWQGSQIVVLDVDDTSVSLSDIISDPYVMKHAASVFPSSSYTPSKTKAHIIIPLDRFITDLTQYKRVGLQIASNLSFPVDTATLTPSQALYGTVFNQPEMATHVRRLDDGLVLLQEAEPVNVVLALAEYLETNLVVDAASKRREAEHRNSDDDKRRNVILDALKWVLTPEWGEKGRDERLMTIMAAFEGSDSLDIRDAFLDYSSPRWDESSQKETLIAWWERHTPREGGITVSSLFAHAKRNGWLRKSSVDLSNARRINESDLSNWILNVPESRVLLKSATGTGKTQAAIKLIKALQENGDTVRAVFFAPSIKLCYALSNALSNAGVDNTLYIEGGRKTKDSEVLRAATVLVTTLQTFAVKVYTRAEFQHYDLVVIDECDELFSSFMRSGINSAIGSASHVNKTQARRGIDALKYLFETATRILLLDGTMTELSRYLTLKWSGSHSIGVYENMFRRQKASVDFYPTAHHLRDDLVESVKRGKKVVVACDTKAEAQKIEALLVLLKATQKENIIRITGDNAADESVNEFFRDVEAGAKQYQVVIYNSAMGSGVSIVDTVPDVLYLIGTYLTPRKLLQMLNRYRRQVSVKAFISPRDSLYSLPVSERYAQLEDAAKVEAALLGITPVPQEDLAKVVTEAALLVAVDEADQSRSVREFFAALLESDGRLYSIYNPLADPKYRSMYKLAADIVKQQRQEVLSRWRSVPPLRKGEPFPDGMTPEDIAAGLLHGYIDSIFPAHHETKLTDDKVANLALTFGRKRGIISKWARPEEMVTSSMSELMDGRRETIVYRLYAARIELFTTLNILFPDSLEKYSDVELKGNAEAFCKEVRKRQAIYDLIATYECRVAAVERKPDVIKKAVTYARQILKSFGLSVKRDNGKRDGEGGRERQTEVLKLDDLQKVLGLMGIYESVDLSHFNKPAFDAVKIQADVVSKQFSKLSKTERQEIVDTIQSTEVSFFDAVLISDYLGEDDGLYV